VRAVVQRVRYADVSVNGRSVGHIERGLLVLLGVTHGDAPPIGTRLAEKVAGLRLFEDSDGRMNLSLTDVGDVRRGRRPSFDAAAPAALAEPLYDGFCEAIERQGIHCERGVFGAHMEVTLVNDGPVTLIIDSDSLDQPRRT
jgi:D-tyrosyl-tRNA(Tyr) deacylase